MDSKREGMDREWAATEMEWTGNGQQERGNVQGMDREWTGRCGVRNLRCHVDACIIIMQISLGTYEVTM